MQPHIEKGHEDQVSAKTLFKGMPGSFPEDIPIDEPSEPAEPATEQERERARRMAIPRIQRGRK